MSSDTPKALDGGGSAAVGSVAAISPFSKRARCLLAFWVCESIRP